MWRNGGNAARAHRDRHLMQRLGQQRPESPSCCRHCASRARIALDGVVQIGKPHRIAQEKDRRVVAHQIPVARIGVEFHREAAYVAFGIGGTAFPRDGRKTDETLGLLADPAEIEAGVARARDVVRHGKGSRRRSLWRAYAVREYLAVEMRESFRASRGSCNTMGPRSPAQSATSLRRSAGLDRKSAFRVSLSFPLGRNERSFSISQTYLVYVDPLEKRAVSGRRQEKIRGGKTVADSAGPALSQTEHLQPRGTAAVVVNTHVAGNEVGGRAAVNIDELLGLRSASGNHELCTCTMIRCPFAEGMRDIGHREGHFGRLARREGFGAEKLRRNVRA